MMEGKLIVEVYEYSQNLSVPVFEFIPCTLSKCLKKNSTSLQKIIKRGFKLLPKKDRDSRKRDEVLRKLVEAGVEEIKVSYNRCSESNEPYIELTNVEQLSIMDADARRKKNMDDIILYGKYKLSNGADATMLMDAQRLSLIYSAASESNDITETRKEICLNITYLQD